MRKKSELNCPNCGAPITGEYCPYCGSVFYDWAALDMDKPRYIKIRLGSQTIMAKAILRHCTMSSENSPQTLYADGLAYTTMMAPPVMEIRTEFEVIPDDGVMYKVIDEKEILRE